MAYATQYLECDFIKTLLPYVDKKYKYVVIRTYENSMTVHSLVGLYETETEANMYIHRNEEVNKSIECSNYSYKMVVINKVKDYYHA